MLAIVFYANKDQAQDAKADNIKSRESYIRRIHSSRWRGILVLDRLLEAVQRFWKRDYSLWNGLESSCGDAVYLPCGFDYQSCKNLSLQAFKSTQGGRFYCRVAESYYEEKEEEK